MDKTIIVNDHRVYAELRKLQKSTRRLGLFAVVSAIYIFVLLKNQNELYAKVKELTQTEGE